LENLLLQRQARMAVMQHRLLRRACAWGALGAAFLLVYGAVLLELARDWGRDENYSHGYLVLPAAAWLAWSRRAELRRLPIAPSAAGALVVLASLLVLLVGIAGIEFFLTRVSMIGVLAGTIAFTLGWRHLRLLAFPLAFLLLMIPLPSVIFNEIAFPLQLVATRLGVGVLQLLEIPVLREGNIIVLATTTLEVAEACSGIRSLISLITLTLLYGYMSHGGLTARTIVTLSAVPTAIVANGLRVAGTGTAAHYYGAAVAEGFFHGFSGWIVFVVSFVAIMGVERLVNFLRFATVTPPRTEWQVGHS
jgi:exosortase